MTYSSLFDLHQIPSTREAYNFQFMYKALLVSVIFSLPRCHIPLLLGNPHLGYVLRTIDKQLNRF